MLVGCGMLHPPVPLLMAMSSGSALMSRLMGAVYWASGVVDHIGALSGGVGALGHRPAGRAAGAAAPCGPRSVDNHGTASGPALCPEGETFAGSECCALR